MDMESLNATCYIYLPQSFLEDTAIAVHRQYFFTNS